MISTNQIDLEGLVAPISAEFPAGADPRADESPGNDYRGLRDARNEARRIERLAADEGIETSEALPYWRTVRNLSQSLLTSQAKDLEVACYLVEAWVRLDSFPGLRAGVALLRELVQQFWDDLYPRPDEGEESSERARPIDRLGGVLPEALLRVPITAAGAVGPFATWQFKQAKDMEETSGTDRDERIRRGAATLEVVKQAAGDTDIRFYQGVIVDLDSALEEMQKLDHLLTERCGAFDAPSTTPLRETMEAIKVAARDLAGPRLDAAEASAAEEGQAAGGSAGAAAAAGAGGPLRSREDAFRMLEQVAQYFERMDPQSLIAYHIKRIVRLGKMSPAEYFSEILEDDSTRDRLFKLVGIEPPKQPE